VLHDISSLCLVDDCYQCVSLVDVRPATEFHAVMTLKKVLTASPWRTGGDHQDALVLCGWRLSSKTWNPITSPWMKQMTWLRIVHSGDWCLRLVLCTP